MAPPAPPAARFAQLAPGDPEFLALPPPERYKGNTTDGDIEYIDDLDSLGNIQMVYKYDTRFLDVSGNIVNEGHHSYIACFVGCTYHCG